VKREAPNDNYPASAGVCYSSVFLVVLHFTVPDQHVRHFADRWFGIIIERVARSREQRAFVVEPQRWKIERTLGCLDWSRILSKEYERTTESSESNIYLASIRLMIRRLILSPK
jgi:transposase